MPPERSLTAAIREFIGLFKCETLSYFVPEAARMWNGPDLIDSRALRGSVDGSATAEAGQSPMQIGGCRDEGSCQLVTPSCPGSSRASTSFSKLGTTWMAGTGPAMTSWRQ